eukprot:TRINITY_DN3845_c0_g1_i13.p1 TRINITY_DN3845_c0_g1~~TRINITY_DN3845_c0_g1_i13.p1  ORF type:complete len:199 (-),score=43.25 TRINITY_DN3845_c0_g1_i13:129-725(-)
MPRKIQLLLLGDGAVGKTCLLKRYNENTFTAHHLVTIGIDFISKPMTLDGTDILLKIWDTAGQERFRTITRSFYKQAEGIILVYDVTKRKTFENIHKWSNSIYENADAGIINCLVANKIDLTEQRTVSREEGQQAADQYKMKYYETSARADINVTEVIEETAREVLANVAEKKDVGRISVGKMRKGKKEQRNGCCTIF